MVWLLKGTGGAGGPPPRLEMLVLNLVVVWVEPLTGTDGSEGAQGRRTREQ